MASGFSTTSLYTFCKYGEKMKIINIVPVLICTLFLSGCAAVQTRTTAFYLPEYTPSDSIAVISADADKNNSLEFANYKKKFETRLAASGYKIVANPDDAKYIAVIAYGIDNGKTSAVSSPVFGPAYSGAAYSGSNSYTMPDYGVVGSSTGLTTTYTRAIALDIVDAASLKSGQPRKVYESRVKSSGTCNVIAGVFNELLKAMFEEFPGENGKTRKASIPFKGQC